MFRELFKNFQLNTFNGLNFIVENINSCSDNLNGGDTDNDPRTGACTGKTRAGVRTRASKSRRSPGRCAISRSTAALTYANVRYRDNLVGADGKPLSNALWQLPGRQISNAPKWTVTGSAAWTPPIGDSGMHALVYGDVRYMTKFNTGSDLDIEKTQDSFAVVNARIGLEGPDDRWGIEFWAQNLFDKNYYQVAFELADPGHSGSTTRAVQAGFFPVATQLYDAFLGEPRTFGVTLRGKLGFARPAPAQYVAASCAAAAPGGRATGCLLRLHRRRQRRQNGVSAALGRFCARGLARSLEERARSASICSLLSLEPPGAVR